MVRRRCGDQKKVFCPVDTPCWTTEICHTFEGFRPSSSSSRQWPTAANPPLTASVTMATTTSTFKGGSTPINLLAHMQSTHKGSRNMPNVFAHVPQFIILRSSKKRTLYDSNWFLFFVRQSLRLQHSALSTQHQAFLNGGVRRVHPSNVRSFLRTARSPFASICVM